jgi:hypothetical protein
VFAFARDPLFNRLVQEKWVRFGRRMYLRRRVGPYLVLLAMFATLLVIRANELREDYAAAGGPTGGDGGPAPFPGWCLADAATWEEGAAAEGWRAACLALQVLLTAGWGPWLLVKGLRQRKADLRDVDADGDGAIDAREATEFVHKNLPFALEVVAAVLLAAAGAARVACWGASEAGLLAAASVVLFSNLLNLLIPFHSVGALVITVYRMLVGDMSRFLAVYMVLLVGFGLAMSMLAQGATVADAMGGIDLPGTSLLSLFFVSLGDNVGGFVYSLFPAARLPMLALAVYLVWVLLSLVLMLNLLIAMMGKTFAADTEDTHRVCVRPPKRALACVRALRLRRRRPAPVEG